MPAIVSAELIGLTNPSPSPGRPDCVRRFDVPFDPAPLRLSAEVRSAGVHGPPGRGSMIFFNLEYERGPIFWDTFLYPDTGTTPWRTLACEVRNRGRLRAVEMHIRFHARGHLDLRNLRIETIDPWTDDADAVVALFGDSTDMTCYLPTEHRLSRRLELLLRDRFADRRVDVHCFAEGGDRLDRLLDSGRLERELSILPRCDVAVIRYGLNDEGKSIDPASFGANLHVACDAVLRRFPRARIFLATTIPPCAEPYNRQAETVAKARALPLIPLDQHIRLRSAAGDSDWHHQAGSLVGRRREANPPANPDGLAGDKHPNAYGAQMIAECYFDHIAPALAELLGAR